MDILLNLTPTGLAVVASSFLCGVALLYLVIMRTLRRREADKG